jgi:hypothetical protein
MESHRSGSVSVLIRDCLRNRADEI